MPHYFYRTNRNLMARRALKRAGRRYPPTWCKRLVLRRFWRFTARHGSLPREP